MIKEIYTLKHPYWLENAGFNKGQYHDHQNLGFILDKNDTIKIRLKKTSNNQKLTLRLLNDDSKTEITKEFGNDWIELKAEYPSVPFIDTPYVNDDISFEVEFEFSPGSKELPIYNYNDDSDSFFLEWERMNTDFALMSLKYNEILIPKRDRDYLKSLQSLDGISLFYDDYFQFINKLAGISFDANTELSNLNSPNRYFMKANKSGAGAASYGAQWTAESSLSTKSFWLNVAPTNWGCLHEIAHGYQGKFMSDVYFSSGEVWNNIYAACYQEERLGDRKFKDGWLYNYGKNEGVENGIINYINNKTPVNNWDFRSKLVFLMMMIKKAGDQCFTYFNQSYRESINFPERNNFISFCDSTLLSMLSKSFANKNNYNMNPFIKRVGGFILERLTDYNISTFATPVYPLYLLIDEKNLSYVREKLNIKENIQLVSSNQLSILNETKKIEVEFSINKFDEVKNNILSILNGEEVIRRQIINDKKITMNIPIGIYNVRLPIGKTSSYNVDNWSLIAGQSISKNIYNYKVKYNSSLLNQTVGFYGLGDESFGSLMVDQENKTIIINKRKGLPHSYFRNELYVKISINDNNGLLVHSADINGDMEETINDIIQFEYGYEIIIYHAETKNRLKSIENSGDIINSKTNTNALLILRQGVVNKSIGDFTHEMLMRRLESESSFLRSNSLFFKNSIIVKDNIGIAINNTKPEVRDELLKKYHDCLPERNNNMLPGPVINFDFKGIGDKGFLNVNIDTLKKEIIISTKKTTPHNYFNETYVSFSYKNKNNNIVYQIEIYGNSTLEEQLITIPFFDDVGGELYLFHSEPSSRMVIHDNDGRIFNSAEHQRYALTEDGLEIMD